jgi:ferredoxin-NADP reductase
MICHSEAKPKNLVVRDLDPSLQRRAGALLRMTVDRRRMENIFHQIKLVHKKMLSRDIMELRFERPSGFSFVAGQFVRFQISMSGEMVSRPYSISSSPVEEYLEFCVKIIPGGKASYYFSQIESGTSALVSAPQGVFICKPEHQPTKMFIATGAGVAPIMSMIEERLENATGENLRLLFGVREVEDVFWAERLDELKASYSNFKYQLTLSRPNDEWKGLRGRVSEHLTHASLDAEYYICGSVEMVKDVRGLLLEKGVGPKTVHFEIF